MINIINTNIIVLIMFLVIIICPTTRRKTIKMICFFAIGMFYMELINKLRDLETVQLLLKLNYKELIQTSISRIRLTSSKAFPDLNQVNVKELLHAIHVRFIMKWISPLNCYIAKVREIWMEIVKLVKLACCDTTNLSYM